MLVLPESSSTVLVKISSMSAPACNHLHAKQVNSGEVTVSQETVHLFDVLGQSAAQFVTTSVFMQFVQMASGLSANMVNQS